MKPDGKLLQKVVEELERRGEKKPGNLAGLAGFLWGKWLSPFSYKDTPELLADAWIVCRVAKQIEEMIRG
jgi:hypothetical protein